MSDTYRTIEEGASATLKVEGSRFLAEAVPVARRPDAEERSYALSANVQYEDQEGDTSVYDDVRLSLSPAPEQNFDVSNVETSLQAGEDGSLSATLTNTGMRDVENVVITWTWLPDISIFLILVVMLVLRPQGLYGVEEVGGH